MNLPSSQLTVIKLHYQVDDIFVNLTKLILLFLDNYTNYYNLSKFS